VNIQNPAANAGADQALCIGDTVQLNAAGGTLYAWSPATGLSDASVAAPLAFPTATTTYTVSVTDGLGCVATDAVVVTVNLLPVVNAGADDAVCAGLSTTVGGSPTGPAGSTYAWSPNTGLNNATTANPTAAPATTTTYTVLVTDQNQCAASDSVVVTVNPVPSIDAGVDTSICLGGSVQLLATGTGQFAWSPATGLSATNIADPVASPSGTTTYTVTLTDANSCVNTDEVTVTVLGLPNADAGADQWVCPGFDVQLNGSGGGTYAWAPSSSLDAPTSGTPQASPSSTTIYVLTVTDGNGCADTDEVTVTVNNDPPLDAGPDQSICAGQQVQLGGSPTSVPGSTFTWSPSAGLDDVNAANPTATPTVTTTYTLTVTNDTCTSSQSVTVTLQGIVVPGFTVRLEPNCEGLRAFFEDQSSGASSWAWDFGDGGTSTEQNPQHLFAYDQVLTVTLTITDLFGCTGSLTQTYPASSFPELTQMEIPNVFSPNGDGQNELFAIGVAQDEQPAVVLGSCSQFLIFNRWGQKIFENFGGNMAWDGRTNAGIACEPGTYFYVLTIKDMEFKGTVQLIR
jgi:gliding motility-associated-like protein